MFWLLKLVLRIFFRSVWSSTASSSTWRAPCWSRGRRVRRLGRRLLTSAMLEAAPGIEEPSTRDAAVNALKHGEHSIQTLQNTRNTPSERFGAPWSALQRPQPVFSSPCDRALVVRACSPEVSSPASARAPAPPSSAPELPWTARLPFCGTSVAGER